MKKSRLTDSAATTGGCAAARDSAISCYLSDGCTWVDLERAPGHLIRRAQQRHNLLWSTHVSDRFSSVQFAALNALAEGEPLDQVSLSACIHTDPATTTELVNRMCRQGHLRRQRSTADGRRNELTLTAEGRGVLAVLVPRVLALEPRIEEPLDAQERSQLHELLGKLLRGRQ